MAGGKILVVLLLVIGAAVNTANTQETCPAGDESVVQLRIVVQQLLVDVTTQYFAETAIGTDGFPLVDESLQYGLFELFEERYGPGTSTAEFLAGLLDVLGASLDGRTNATDHLAAVIGLAQRGDYDSARKETILLIVTSLEESGLFDATVDWERLTSVQVELVYRVLTPVFVTIRNSLTNVAFERYLNLAVGSTLALVMDTTGSMSAEIAASQARFVDIVETTRGTVNQPLLYVLSPYNDPAHGPVTVTSDPAVIIPAINTLTASGGGDFPELALVGIYDALLASSRRSVLFHITDASAKDVELESRVIALAIIRRIRIINLLTQEVPDEAGQPLYNRLSRATGGLTTVIQRSDIESVTQLFTALTAQGQVIIAFNTFTTAPSLTVPIDPSVKSLTIRVAGVTTSAVTSIEAVRLDADGSESIVATNSLIEANGLFLLTVHGTSRWSASSSLQLKFNGDLALGYSVEVAADSVFGAITHLKQLVGGVYINIDQYKAGSSGFVETSIFGDVRGVRLTKVQLQAEDGSVLLDVEVTRCRDDEYYTTPQFTIPDQRFFIVVLGVDKHGIVFRRSDSVAITPLVSDISISQVLDQTVMAGSTVEVSFNVTNSNGSALQLTYDVSDAEGYVQTFFPSIGVIANTMEQPVTVTVKVPSDAEDGAVSRVTATATPNTESDDFLFTSFNIIVKNPSTRKCRPLLSKRGGNVNCDNSFNEGSTCLLTCNPGFIARTVVTSQCVDGEWTVASLECEEVGFSECQAAGDPHYRTFDNRRYDFMGTCAYTLVETTFNTSLSTLTPFDIQVENEVRGGRTSVSWFKQAFVRVYDVTVNFRQGRQVVVNGLLVNLPFSVASRGLNIELSGSNVVLTTRFGLEVRYNGNANFVVSLSGAYGSQVQGLCGNFNGDGTDDLTLPANPNATVSADEFGNYFKSGGLAAVCVDGDFTEPECDDRDTYEELCKIVDDDCFKECSKVIPTPGIFQDCIFDMCVTEGSRVAFEQAIATYAQQCQLANIKICNWRDETEPPIVPVCGAHSHFEHEGTACPNTCRSPNQADRCTRPNMSGCVCDEGFVLSGEQCVPLEECGCTSDGRYYLKGEEFYTDECAEYCVCNGGELECSTAPCADGEVCKIEDDKLQCAPESYAECKGHGDPHYITFDGRKYNYMGKCKYRLVGIRDDVIVAAHRHFTIDVENEVRNGKESVTWLKEATFAFFHPRFNSTVTVVMNRDDAPKSKGQALVSGLWGIETARTQVTAYRDEMVDIQTSASGVVVRYGQVTVNFNKYIITVTIPSFYKNKVNGLCGTYNDDKKDDLTNSTDVIVTNKREFGDSWLVGGCGLETPPENDAPCTPEQQTRWEAVEFCGVITAETGPFGECSKLIDLTTLVEDCLFDMCVTDGDLQVLSEILTLVSRQCAEKVSCGWRKEVAAVADLFVCPENSVYSGCAPACPATCFDPLAPARCSLPAVEGCVCKLGYVMLGGKCIPASDCGCYSDEYGYVEQGFESSNEDCTERCSCNGPGRYECKKYECKGLEQCLKSADSYRCVVPAERCMMWGNYVKQFDGFRYNLNRAGRFVAVTSDGNDDVPPFTVDVLQGVAHPVTGIRTYKTTIRYMWKGRQQTAIIFPGSRFAYVNQVRLLAGSNFRGIQVIQQGLFTTLAFEFGGLVVSSHVQQGVIVSVGGVLLNDVQGICGSWNNDVTDDETDDVGPLLEDNSRPVEDDEEVITIPTGCEQKRYTDYIRAACGFLKTDTLLTTACAKLDVSVRYRACVRALKCQETNFLATLEAHVIGYVTECIMESGDGEIPALPIRDDIGIQYECPSNSHYVNALSGCPKTCGDKRGSKCSKSIGLTILSGVEGCECDEGFVLSGDECVPEDQCGCARPDNGIYLKHGEFYVSEGCSEKCQCRNGEWNCEVHRCYKSQTCGVLEGLPRCISIDKCRDDNGGCQGLCTFNKDTNVATCSCMDGFALRPDMKTCVAVAEDTLDKCSAQVMKWRADYVEWKAEFVAWKERAADTSSCPAYCAPQWSLEGIMIGVGSGKQSCDVYWTEWFNSDKPDGCGDDETIERIRDVYPDKMCDNVITLESRIESPATCVSGVSSVIKVTTNNRIDGFYCDNSDQPIGIQCPDYAVRFLCVN